MRPPKLLVLPVLAALALFLAACSGQAPIALTTVGPADGSDGDSAATSTPTRQPTEEPTTEPTSASKSITELAVGDCILDPPSEEDSKGNTVTVIDCDSPHFQELYHIGQNSLTDYDEAAVLEEARTGCGAALSASASDPSGYESLILYQNSTGWASGDRSYYCFAYNRDQSEMTGSIVEGSSGTGGSDTETT